MEETCSDPGSIPGTSTMFGSQDELTQPMAKALSTPVEGAFAMPGV
jgi:hypothetical protein